MEAKCVGVGVEGKEKRGFLKGESVWGGGGGSFKSVRGNEK